ncbi:unnamed protein product [Rotaria socialis]|uniref:Cullin family profile domain-containing protein n=1 Tax=Rotaria socialis TaxID=392032 RepID=A0A821NGZ6_9BILA|nr:unnamed protein product [Rotaria socialis]
MAEDRKTKLWINIENYIAASCDFEERSPYQYMELCSQVYNYITDAVSVKLTPAPKPRRVMQDEANVIGGDVYDHIAICLRNKLSNICENMNHMTDADMIRLYVQHFRSYKNSCRLLNSPLNIVNRHWVRREFDSVKDHRNNKSFTDTEVVKSFVELYSSLDSNSNRNELSDEDFRNEPTTNIDKKSFESEFLQDALDFYRNQEVPILVAESVIEYLSQISIHFDFEIKFAESILPKSTPTFQILIDKLEGIFLPEQNLNLIMDTVKTMVLNENVENLRLLYKPVSQIPKVTEPLEKLIQDHIRDSAINTIGCMSDAETNDPKVFVEKLIAIYKHFSKIFDVGPKFKSALDKACGKFINDNKVTQKTGKKTTPAEFLARYCHTILAKRNKTIEENDFKEKIDQILILFAFIKDKDVFKNLHHKLLAKRLIYQSSVSPDDEKLIISELKQQCGSEYSSRLERMLQDVDVSTTLNDDYRTYCQKEGLEGIVNFSPMVFSSNAWPLSPISCVILPNELKATFNSFHRFYINHHSGRKLTCLHQYSQVELQTYFTDKKYRLQVSTYQMIVLLLFNEQLIWTVEAIQNKTQIESDFLFQVLVSLLKKKILVSEEISEDFQESHIKENHKIELKNDFSSKNLLVNLRVTIKSSNKKDSEYSDESINDDRRSAVEAKIAKIMKEQRTLEYKSLIEKVMEQLIPCFKPNVRLIKRCIDRLIDRGYLKRDSNNKDILHYLY